MDFPYIHQTSDLRHLPENHLKWHGDIRLGNDWPFFFYFNQGTNFATNQFRLIEAPPHCSQLKEGKSKDLRSIPVDVIVEILTRLPVKNILRLRSVCKFWHSLTQEQQFSQRHLQISKPNADDFGIAAVLNQVEKHKLSINYFVNGIHEFDITPLYKENDYKISNSCDGLICIYGNRTTYLINPSIKEAVVLPQVNSGYEIIAVALVKIASTGEYRIVRTFRHKDATIRLSLEVFCEVFDSNSHSWRPVHCSPPLYDCLFNPVVLNGAIHWMTGPSFGKNIVLSLDLITETVNIIKEPEGFPDRGDCDIFLVDFDGYLCIAASSPSSLPVSVIPYSRAQILHWFTKYTNSKELWVLKDYENLVWERICICMEHIEHWVNARHLYPVAVRDGKILWHDMNKEFTFYDIEKSSFISFTGREQLPYRVICAYNESLISPATILERNRS